MCKEHFTLDSGFPLWGAMWLLASPGPRGSVIFAPFWGQVTKPLFLSCMIVSSAVRDYFAR